MGIDFRSALFGAIAAIVAICVIAALYLALGFYDVGADAPHWGVTRAVIGYARERSITVRARDVMAPSLNEPGRVADGASDYDAMCTACHLAPGMKENEMRPGLNPKPPKLAVIPALPPAVQFWVIKHGIKMSGMPAWGKTHSDDEIWNMVAFLQKLPKLTPGEYKMLVGIAAGHHDHDKKI
ncbi:MAG TPA: cytochrome c [Rhizomicrobium sp.]|nr:cytochrome c [Rhizomicrobium sp.]